MKLNRKLVLVLALLMSVAMITTGTLAYLTDRDSDVNVFTVGNVDITLEDGREATVTLKGQKNKFYLALWQLKGAKDNGIWNYAIGVQGMDEQDLLELVKMVLLKIEDILVLK